MRIAPRSKPRSQLAFEGLSPVEVREATIDENGRIELVVVYRLTPPDTEECFTENPRPSPSRNFEPMAMLAVC